MVGSKVKKGDLEIYGTSRGVAASAMNLEPEVREGLVEEVEESSTNEILEERRRKGKGMDLPVITKKGAELTHPPGFQRLPTSGEDFVMFAEALKLHLMPQGSGNVNTEPNPLRQIPVVPRQRNVRLPKGHLQSRVWRREPSHNEGQSRGVPREPEKRRNRTREERVDSRVQTREEREFEGIGRAHV